MKLNLCSGQRPFGEGWTNVDSQGKWRPDVCCDCTYMPMFEDGSADMIVIHHGLEHFGCGEAEPLIKESHRILAPGGSLLVFVPDMRELVRMWIEGQLTTQVFMTNVYGAYMGDEADRHKWGFDRASLNYFLRSCALWNRVLTFDWRKIEGADIAQAEWVLSQECIK